MKVLRFAVIAALMLGPGSFRVMRAQLSSPYEKRIEQAEQAKQLSDQRKKQIRLDSDKLLKLSGELRQLVYNSAPDILSADSLKKAAEIEKLAHRIREQLKY
jgi:hypothetical protein